MGYKLVGKEQEKKGGDKEGSGKSKILQGESSQKRRVG